MNETSAGIALMGSPPLFLKFLKYTNAAAAAMKINNVIMDELTTLFIEPGVIVGLAGHLH